MTRREKLKEFQKIREEKKANLKKAHEDWMAHDKAFLAWLGKETGIEGEDIHISDILNKWDEANDKSPEASH